MIFLNGYKTFFPRFDRLAAFQAKVEEEYPEDYDNYVSGGKKSMWTDMVGAKSETSLGRVYLDRFIEVGGLCGEWGRGEGHHRGGGAMWGVGTRRGTG